MSDLEELYQQTIIDHSRRPHNFHALKNPSYSQEGYNPLCGDKFTVYVNEKDGIITEVSFEGTGCAISTASASLMTDVVKNKTTEEILEIFDAFQKLVTTGKTDQPEKLDKLTVLAGVFEFPTRVKCATLPWHTLKSALNKDGEPISTE